MTTGIARPGTCLASASLAQELLASDTLPGFKSFFLEHLGVINECKPESQSPIVTISESVVIQIMFYDLDFLFYTWELYQSELSRKIKLMGQQI